MENSQWYVMSWNSLRVKKKKFINNIKEQQRIEHYKELH
jgi:hypothetical protein